MEFTQVKEEHILKGIEDFEVNGFPKEFEPFSTYDLVYKGYKYPPKTIMAYANFHAIGKEPKAYFKGGLETDCFTTYKRNGFEVMKKDSNEDSLEGYLKEFSSIADQWFGKENWLE